MARMVEGRVSFVRVENDLVHTPAATFTRGPNVPVQNASFDLTGHGEVFVRSSFRNGQHDVLAFVVQVALHLPDRAQPTFGRLLGADAARGIDMARITATPL